MKTHQNQVRGSKNTEKKGEGGRKGRRGKAKHKHEEGLNIAFMCSYLSAALGLCIHPHVLIACFLNLGKAGSEKRHI